ncbi:hypothetical protein BCR39DRAFT_555829 [Naematelia encephala]|uniref:Uncharacterized protein n=1 Tax=Naematelia encephala TaxID=71784 RepID=A0A1Y2BLY8_9TREE|nr:hypothetical protein BCR39DRAFT_555829 [Naematelia encephala]
MPAASYTVQHHHFAFRNDKASHIPLNSSALMSTDCIGEYLEYLEATPAQVHSLFGGLGHLIDSLKSQSGNQSSRSEIQNQSWSRLPSQAPCTSQSHPSLGEGSGQSEGVPNLWELTAAWQENQRKEEKTARITEDFASSLQKLRSAFVAGKIQIPRATDDVSTENAVQISMGDRTCSEVFYLLWQFDKEVVPNDPQTFMCEQDSKTYQTLREVLARPRLDDSDTDD